MIWRLIWKLHFRKKPSFKSYIMSAYCPRVITYHIDHLLILGAMLPWLIPWPSVTETSLWFRRPECSSCLHANILSIFTLYIHIPQPTNKKFRAWVMHPSGLNIVKQRSCFVCVNKTKNSAQKYTLNVHTYERIRQWLVTDIGVLPLVNESSRNKKPDIL